MCVNIPSEKCKGCKYRGIYLCTNSKKCVNQELYKKRKK